jgi:hypothetical protein
MCVYEDYVKRPKKLAKDKAEEKHQTPLQHRLEVLCFIHSSFFLPFYALSGNKQKQKKKELKSHKILFLQFQALFIRFLLYCFRW